MPCCEWDHLIYNSGSIRKVTAGCLKSICLSPSPHSNLFFYLNSLFLNGITSLHPVPGLTLTSFWSLSSLYLDSTSTISLSSLFILIVPVELCTTLTWKIPGTSLTSLEASTLFPLQSIFHISTRTIFLKYVLSLSFSISQFISNSVIPATGLQTQIPSGDLSITCDWMFRTTGSNVGLLTSGENEISLKAFTFPIFRTTVLTKWTTKFHKIKARLFGLIFKAPHDTIPTYFSRPKLFNVSVWFRDGGTYTAPGHYSSTSTWSMGR